jgi:hypothetical protein
MANAKLPNFLKTLLIGLVVLAVLAPGGCGSSPSDETEPYVPKIGKAKLLHPKRKATVPAGMTKGDLDRLFKATLKPYSSIPRNERELEKTRDEAFEEFVDMKMSGRILWVVSGTECRVIEADSKYSKVRILEGPSHQFGKTVWVFSSTVVNR